MHERAVSEDDGPGEEDCGEAEDSPEVTSKCVHRCTLSGGNSGYLGYCAASICFLKGTTFRMSTQKPAPRSELLCVLASVTSIKLTLHPGKNDLVEQIGIFIGDVAGKPLRKSIRGIESENTFIRIEELHSPAVAKAQRMPAISEYADPRITCIATAGHGDFLEPPFLRGEKAFLDGFGLVDCEAMALHVALGIP